MARPDEYVFFSFWQHKNHFHTKYAYTKLFKHACQTEIHRAQTGGMWEVILLDGTTYQFSENQFTLKNNFINHVHLFFKILQDM